MRKITNIFLFLISGIHIAYALEGASPIFEKISIEDGMSQSDIKDIIQDNVGFMWFATNNGLNRYDGYSFSVFKQSQNRECGLSSNITNCLYTDKKGHLWVGTQNGVDCYVPALNKFHNYTQMYASDGKDSLGILRVQAIAEDGDSDIWITSAEYLGRLDTTTDKFIYYRLSDLAQDQAIAHIDDIAVTKNGAVLLGTNRGLYMLNKKTMNVHRLFSPHHIHHDTTVRIYDIHPDETENCIYLCTEAGVFVLDSDGNYLYEILHKGHSIAKATCIAKDYSKNKWIGTADKGIYCVHQNTVYHYIKDSRINTSLSSNEILSIYHDKSGILWIGTSTGGVNKFPLLKKPFHNINHDPFNENSLSHNTIRGLVIDNNNILWAGMRTNCINRIDLKHNSVTHHYIQDYPDIIISCLTKRNTRELWAGTSFGLFTFDMPTGNFRYFPVDGIPQHMTIINMVTDTLGRLWCGTSSGIFILANGKLVDVGSPTQRLLPNKHIRTLYKDRKGNIWVGTRDSGAYCFNMGTDSSFIPSIHYMSHLDNPFSISHNDISIFFEDWQGRLWIGTWGGGLNRLVDRQTGSFTHYTEEDGLSDNVIFSIHEDLSGALWLATYNGLSYFEPETGVFKVYTSQDGLLSNEFAVKASAQSQDGIIYLGSIHGITYFDPEKIKTYVSPMAKAAITSLRIFNNEIMPGTVYRDRIILPKAIFALDKIKLSYLDKLFSFDFASFSYIAPERNQFAYMLEGLDTEWNYVKSKHSASYSNLKPGKYRFLLKSSNSDGVWNEIPNVLSIEITPPFWQTIFAYILYVVICLLILVYFFYRFKKRMIAKSRSLVQKVRKDSEVQLYDEKMKFYINISHDLRTPLTLIIGLINRVDAILGENSPVKKQLNVMHRNAELLLRLITELLDLRKIETGNMEVKKTSGDIIPFTKNIFSIFEESARSQGISFLFRSEIDSLLVTADFDKTEKIIYNLLSNAVKFTKNNIEVGIYTLQKGTENNVVIYVRDNGKGISPREIDNIFQRFYQSKNSSGNTGSGIGLNIALEMARLQGGDLTVSSTEGEGTTFYLHIPANEEKLSLRQLSGDSDQINKSLVLVIDDNEDMRYYIGEILRTDFRIREAANGEEGIKLVHELNPDLVISDVMMPGMSGLELCEKLKKDPHTMEIPIILITAKNSDKERVSGLGKGADAYLIKPFAEEHLTVQVENLIKRRKAVYRQFKIEQLSTPKQITVTSAEEKMLLKVVSLIETHISDERYTIEALCSDLKISPMQLHRQMKRTIGDSPGKFIQNFRLSRAADLLQLHKMNVSEVAFAVGFSDPKYFRQCFKRKYGKTPLQYIHDAENKPDSMG